SEDIMAKNMQLLRETLPRARRIAVLSNPNNASNPILLKEVLTLAPGIRLAATSFEAGSLAQLESTLDVIARQPFDALLMIRDGLFAIRVDRLIAYQFARRTPVFAGQSGMVEAGCLMTYDTLLVEQHRRSARYVANILGG